MTNPNPQPYPHPDDEPVSAENYEDSVFTPSEEEEEEPFDQFGDPVWFDDLNE